MTTASNLATVLIDSSIPIALIFEKGMYSELKVDRLVAYIAETSGIECHTLPSVDKECLKKFDEIADKIGDVVKQFMTFLGTKLGSAGRDYLVEDDVFAIEQYFTQKIGTARSSSGQVDLKLQEQIRALEFWIVEKSRELFRKAGKIQMKELASDLDLHHRDNFLKVRTDYESYKVKYWNQIDARTDQELVNHFAVTTKTGNLQDLEHLSCAFVHSLEKDTWVIFCSLDYRDIVSRKDFEKFLLLVSDPTYVPYYCNRLRRMYGSTRPRFHIKSMQTNPSGVQMNLPLLNALEIAQRKLGYKWL